MDWKARIREVFTTGSHVPDDDVIEELAQHAQAMYHNARTGGLSHEEADRRVADQLDRWRIDAAALCHRSRGSALVEPAPGATSSPFAGLAQDIRYAARLLRRRPRSALL